MYRKYISKTEREQIIAEYGQGNTSIPPHCNDTMFHEPGICAFCDGYYKWNPNFHPTSYVTREANGWGGNMAPIVDNEKAAEEDLEWELFFKEIIK